MTLDRRLLLKGLVPTYAEFERIIGRVGDAPF